MKTNHLRGFFLWVFIFQLNLLSAQDTLYNQLDSLGRFHGVFKHYDRDTKQLMEIITYFHGRMNGHSIQYYENGVVRFDGFYKNDTIDGKCIIRRPDGTLYQVENYRVGRLHGIKQFYDEEGKIHEEATYEEGFLRGIVRTYFKNGRIQTETTMIGQVEQGTRKIFEDTPRNEIIREFDFVDGERVESRFYKNGQLVKVEK